MYEVTQHIKSYKIHLWKKNTIYPYHKYKSESSVRFRVMYNKHIIIWNGIIVN